MQIINEPNNEGMIIDLLTIVLNIDIREINKCELKRFENISEYGFSVVKVNISLYQDKNIEIYLNYCKKEKVKQNIFCFWCMIYENESKKIEQEEKTPYITINKVQISKIAREKYKDSILLQKSNNELSILKKGMEIHLVDFYKYIQSNKNKYNELQEWEKYIEKGSDDILLIGMIPDEEIKQEV